MMKDDPYMKLQRELQMEKTIRPEGENTLDPNRPDKKKDKNRKKVKFAGDDDEESKDSDDDSSD